MRLTRLYDFQDGTKAYSSQIDEEYNQILNVLNGNIESDNIKDGSITLKKLQETISLVWQDEITTKADLDLIVPTTTEIRLVTDEGKLYFYNTTTSLWEDFLASVESRLTVNEGDISTIKSDIVALQSEQTTQNNRLTTLEADIHTHTNQTVLDKVHQSGTETSLDLSKIATNEANISTLSTDKADKTQLQEYEKKAERGTVAPTDLTKLWIDTNLTPPALKFHNGTDWVITGDGAGSSTTGASIDDTVTALDKTWSSDKINTELGTKAESTHGHAISEVTNLSTELAGKEPSFTKNTAFNKNFGGNAGEVAEGNHNHDTSYQAKSTELDKVTTTPFDGTQTEYDLSNIRHNNRKVIDEFSEDTNGDLLFKGSGVGGGNLKVSLSTDLPNGKEIGTLAVVKKDHSVHSFGAKEETKDLIPTMTSDTAPFPYVASASSENTTADYSPWKAFDNNDGTAWISNATAPEWLQIDIGQERVMKKISILSRNFNGYASAPEDFTIWGSKDGVNFDDLGSYIAVGWVGDLELKTFDIPTVGSYRYYRVEATKTQGGNSVAMAKMQLHDELLWGQVVTPGNTMGYLNARIQGNFAIPQNAWSVVPFKKETDTQSEFDDTSSVFTTKTSGIYQMDVSAHFSGNTAGIFLRVLKNNDPFQGTRLLESTEPDLKTTVGMSFDLQSGDTLVFEVYTTESTVSLVSAADRTRAKIYKVRDL